MARLSTELVLLSVAFEDQGVDAILARVQVGLASLVPPRTRKEVGGIYEG